MTQTHQHTSKEEILWAVAKVKDNAYAIDSTQVEAIFLLEEEITPVAHSQEDVLGIVSFRGGILPIVDLRLMLGMPSRREEEEAFEQMLEQRKQDHVNWVQELKRCLRENDTFHLATDPHKCAFGRWYDNYEPTSHTVAFHLKKIDEPHQRLHRSAEDAFACSQDHEHCTRQECLFDVVKNGVERYMGQVVGLLEDAKKIFRSSYRRMVIVVSDGQTACGLLVDEVLSVEQLVDISVNDRSDVVRRNPWVDHVATRKGSDELIMALNLAPVFEKDLSGMDQK